MCDIYNREVTETTITLDLTPRTVEDQQRYIADRSGALGVVVAESADEVIGFASLSFYRDRPGYRTSVEDSVYVARGHHGQGVGSSLLAELIAMATNHGFHAMFAKVVGGGEASLALHQRHGFSIVGVEREVGRKFGRWHDVTVLQRLL